MCTGIRIIAQDKSIVYARTLEFGKNIESQILFIPRNYQFIGTAPSGNPEGLKWKSKYAAIGMNASGVTQLVDGINEVGLAGGLFYFPDYAEYQQVNSDQIAKSIGPWELITWILTNFSNVDEVREHLPKIKVGNTIFKSWGIIPPIHAIVHDLSGKSLVIEYVKGNLILTDNPIGVFTNSPSFDWHLTNLRNYINLSAYNVSEIEINNMKLTPLGQGSGMIGLPGDFTSPSRFVRIATYSQAIIGVTDSTTARDYAFHLLNLFDIPYGAVRQKENGSINYEYTQWTSAADLKNKLYYITTHENRNIQMVDLLKMKLDSEEPRIINVEKDQTIFDVTSK